MKIWRSLIGATMLIAPQLAGASFPRDLVEKGRYLAIAGDCTACHTAPGGAAFAGGAALASPLGPIVATNITPSKRYGIGRYSEAQFAAALRLGIRADGRQLYPAMPYTSYALLSDADIHALYAYFMNGIQAIERPTHATKLPFPFNIRSSMALWNRLFLNRRRFAADPSHDDRWNRGAYLVRALGHCSACHSPRGWLMDESRTRALGGAPLGTWYAPDITSDRRSGIGGWSNADLVSYFRTGIAMGKARAAGGMAEVVEHSLSKLTDDDLAAIAAYLKTVPPVSGTMPAGPVSQADALSSIEPDLRGAASASKSGAALFSGLCASCHGSMGTGTADRAFPSLSPMAKAARPDNLIAVILNGVDRRVGSSHVMMPGFGAGSYVQPLTDEQVAAIATFVRSRSAPEDRVTASDVAKARAGGRASPLLKIFYACIAALGLVGFAVISLWVRRRAS